MAYHETIAGVTYDELFAGPEVKVMTKNVTFKSGTNVARGVLLSIDAGTGKVIATPAAAGETPAGVAVYVAKEAVDASTADKVGTVYTAGYFNREKLIAAEGDTVTAHEEELRGVGILLSSLK